MTATTRIGVSRLAAARLVSCTGSSAAYTALFFVVYQKTHSALWVSVAMVATVAAGGLIAPFAGALADRGDRKALMIASDLVAAACYLLLAPDRGPAAIVVLALLATMAEAPFLPASSAALPALANGDDELPWANGRIAVGTSVGKTCGPLLAGAVIALTGPGGVFLANAVSFLCSAALIAGISGSFRADETRVVVRQRRGRELLEGFSFLAADRVLRLCAVSEASAWTFTTLATVSETALAAHYHAGALGYAALVSGWAGGMVAGALLAGQVVSLGNELSGFLAGRVAMAAGIGLVALSTSLAATVILLALGGAGSGFLWVARQSLYQRRIPDALRGRVFASTDAIGTACFALGVLAAGVLVNRFGAQTAYLVSGAGVAAGSWPLIKARQALARRSPARRSPAAPRDSPRPTLGQGAASDLITLAAAAARPPQKPATKKGPRPC